MITRTFLGTKDSFTAQSVLSTIYFRKMATNLWQCFTGSSNITEYTKDEVLGKIKELEGQGFKII